jgi:hypothetical protein
MPEFNTQTPRQERNRPNRVRTLLIESKHRILLVSNKLRTLLVANRLRMLLIGGGILLLVVAVPLGLLLGLLISTPSWLWPDDQAKDVKVPEGTGPEGKVPEYIAEPEYRDCRPVAGVETADTVCYDVVTQAHDAESLARITRDIARGEDVDRRAIVSAWFYTEGGQYTGGTVFFTSPFAKRIYTRDYGDATLRRAKVIDGVYLFRSY